MYRPPVVSEGLKWHRMRVWSTACPRYVMTLQSNGCARCFGFGYCPYLEIHTMVTEMRYEGKEREKARAGIPIVVTADAIISVDDVFVLCIRAHFTKVPQAKSLVLPIGNHVATVAFG
jgi:hypothetical protein